ncbi:hypothetical protein [Acidianus brierleyi]|uniref:Uncharacterized protein n=1 Tax=Acidianus brierleyi TaxID=41673 RepID=A0A2U9ID71_9CREN|nr:hypothetical protein [Acidianus brierleyi]AWR93962.1 hypothetical protein DFR85_04340 [Acidianus brierleyi]
MRKLELVTISMLLASIELTLVSILNISISNYDLLKYPFGLTEELPPLYWITEFLTALSFVIPLLLYKNFNKRIYSLLMPISFLLLLFNTFFIFYFINPVFVLSRDEMGHSTEVMYLLLRHTTLLNPGTYQAHYPLGFIYGAISYIFSGITPTYFFIYFGPMFFPIIQTLAVYGLIRLFFKSPYSELGILIYIFSSMPFYVAEWSPQLMSYNLLFPIFLIVGLIVKKGGLRFTPLLVVLSGLTGLTDIGTFGSAVTIAIGALVFAKKIGKLNIKFIAYSGILTASIYMYWVYFDPIASGALGGDYVLLGDFIDVIKSIFIPQSTKNLVLPTSTLIYTFLPPSPYHFISVASKLLDGGIFLLFSLISFLILVIRRKSDKYVWLTFALGSALLVMQTGIGLADNVSNVLTRMIPQAMAFYTILIVYFLYNKNLLTKAFSIFLVILIPLSILGYAMIATSEHSPEAAFFGGKLLGEYGLSSDPTYGFYQGVYQYEGKMVPTIGITYGDINFAGPYIETLALYFGGPSAAKGFEEYNNYVMQNESVIFNSGEMIVGLK